MGVTAFIPVRKGSKSIPLKNIKYFCGAPLVFWTVQAAQQAPFVDRVVVATDSSEIKEVVMAFQFSKVQIYDRDPVNAQDTSSTESVMLEFIRKAFLPPDEVLLLIQATSPLLTVQDLVRANDLYLSGKYDSLLSAVSTKRFFWNADGVPVNYNYRNRPRRQDFPGMYMENGAFYFSTVKNILASENRLSGKIGISVMPEYTATEIDEPNDWFLMESLMREKVLRSNRIKRRPKLFLTDVDGVLTDAGMYYSESGDELKKFNTRDGMGIQLLRDAGIKTGIITSEKNQIVTRRAQKLKIDFVEQAQRNNGKRETAQKLCNSLGCTLSEVAYIGDDINCMELLSAVGQAACPADAVEKVQQIPHIFHLHKKGGEGCVREFIEYLLQ